jgi:3-hydroxyacyl-[acyl-carrier-protein] dehydratase
MIDGEIQLEGSRAVGFKYVTGTEPFVLGHYPQNPLFPGVLSVELMLEVGSFLVRRQFQKACRPSGLQRVHFLDVARPGDVLKIEAEVKQHSERVCLVSGAISADGHIKARAAVTFLLGE